MPQLRPSWQLSFATVAVLILIAVLGATVARRRRGSTAVVAFSREFAVVMAVFGTWQYVGRYWYTRIDGAKERALMWRHWEHRLGLPDETAVQSLVLGHPWLVRALDTYYAYAHLNGMTVFVVWMWWRHRQVYARMRWVVVVATLTCFAVQTTPVAPPRLLPEYGYVDTARLYGESVYGEFGSTVANQLAAMPSVHVGWAVIVGFFVWRCAPNPWRWVGPMHAALTVFVVVATGNHWWADGVVATAIVAAAGLAVHAAARIPVTLTRRRPIIGQDSDHVERRERFPLHHDPAGTTGAAHGGQ
jgi:hypothetical protein